MALSRRAAGHAQGRLIARGFLILQIALRHAGGDILHLALRSSPVHLDFI
jgi:hypothetical protein